MISSMRAALWRSGRAAQMAGYEAFTSKHRAIGSHFGLTSYWQSLYEVGGPEEWFLDARIAARGAAVATKQAGKREALRVWHPGCGLSSLGAALVYELGADTVRRVDNCDCSARALERLRAKISRDYAAAAHLQYYQTWEAGDRMPNAYDLVLDKGTLDALQFAGQHLLAAYLSSVRDALVADRGLYLHWSDEPPELKTDLLRATFPEIDGFSVTWAVEEDYGASHLPCTLGHDVVYFRYAVLRNA